LNTPFTDNRVWACRSAFTLIELLAVIGIIVLLVSATLTGYGYIKDSAKKTRMQSECRMIEASAMKYEFQRHTLPVPDGTFDHTNSVAYSDDNNVVISLLTSSVPPYLDISMFDTNASKSVVDPWKVSYKILLSNDMGSTSVKVSGSK
jgi:prepilin-type N-terminal cleavage/methylation domain-containing protein